MTDDSSGERDWGSILKFIIVDTAVFLAIALVIVIIFGE
tara:strand:+ start:1661 stop:1777 length:117 start_codon:yes stop_codon:yes gene_type:complete